MNSYTNTHKCSISRFISIFQFSSLPQICLRNKTSRIVRAKKNNDLICSTTFNSKILISPGLYSKFGCEKKDFKPFFDKHWQKCLFSINYIRKHLEKKFKSIFLDKLRIICFNLCKWMPNDFLSEFFAIKFWIQTGEIRILQFTDIEPPYSYNCIVKDIQNVIQLLTYVSEWNVQNFYVCISIETAKHPCFKWIYIVFLLLLTVAHFMNAH